MRLTTKGRFAVTAMIDLAMNAQTGAVTEQINIAQIISAAEDRLDATQCGSKANCHHGAPCLTHDLWENLNKTINDYLSGVTLQSIIEQKNCSDSSHVVTFTHIH